METTFNLSLCVRWCAAPHKVRVLRSISNTHTSHTTPSVSWIENERCNYPDNICILRLVENIERISNDQICGGQTKHSAFAPKLTALSIDSSRAYIKRALKPNLLLKPMTEKTFIRDHYPASCLFYNKYICSIMYIYTFTFWYMSR